MQTHWTEQLVKLGACLDAIQWARRENGTTFAQVRAAAYAASADADARAVTLRRCADIVRACYPAPPRLAR
jgi:hypothetical protein